MRVIFLIILLCCQLTNDAQQLLNPLLRSFPVTGTYSKNFNDVFSFAANLAVLSSVKTPVMGVYSEKRFLLSELHFFMVSAIFPCSSGGVGLMFNYGGNSFFNESRVAVSFGKTITDLISLGMQFNYTGIKGSAEKRTNMLNAELGVLIHLADRLQGGFQLKNIFSVNNSKEKLPVAYHAGIGYDCSEKVLLTATIAKQQAVPSQVTVAIHYLIVPSLSISFGTAAPVNTLFLGIELRRKEERLQLNAGYHSQLGFTPSLACIFPLRKKVKE